MQNALASRRLADVHRLLKHNEEAHSAYDAAIAGFRGLAVRFPDEPQYRQELAECYNGLGELLRPYDPAGAKKAYDQAYGLQEHLVGDSPQHPEYRRELARTTINRGIVQEALGDDGAARRDYEQAIRAWEELRALRDQDRSRLSSYSNELSWAYSNLGTLLRRQGERQGAEASYGKAIKLGEELTRTEPRRRQYRRELAQYYNNLANLQYEGERRQEAMNLNLRALDLLEGVAAPAPELGGELANAEHTLGVILDELGRKAEAAGAFDRAIAIFERLEGQYPDFSKEPTLNDRFGNSLLGRGKLLYEGGRFEAAAETLCRAVGHHRDRGCLSTDYWYLSRSFDKTRTPRRRRSRETCLRGSRRR